MAAVGGDPVALTIAGSDSSGGAGIQADLKTFAVMGVYGACAITALTAQNSLGVQAIMPVEPAFVLAQIDSVLADFNVTAAKTGMLATTAIARAVSARLAARADIKLVVDPVMIATSGAVLLDDEAIAIYLRELLPRATLATPNLPEAARLLGGAEAADVDDAVAQCKALVGLGCAAVLLKGGHGAGAEIVDVLCDEGGVTLFRHRRVDTNNTHGTGCTLSAAITASLATGKARTDAVAEGIEFVTAAVEAGRTLRLGSGHGPVNHMLATRARSEVGI